MCEVGSRWRGEGSVGFGLQVRHGFGDVEGGAPFGERCDSCFAEGFEERGVGRREHFEGRTRSPSFLNRVGLAEEDSGGLARPDRAQRDASRGEGPTHDSEITQFERPFGGVGGLLEGPSPVTTSSRDPRSGCDRVRNASPVTVPSGDLDGFVVQGERALRLLERDPARKVLEGHHEHALDAGRTADAHGFFSGRDCGVERRFGDHEHAAKHDECGREFECVAGCPRELDPSLRVTSRPAYVTNEQDGTVSVITTATGAVSATLAVAGPARIAITPDGKHAYVTDYLDGQGDTVSVITTATGAVSAPITTGKGAAAVAICPARNAHRRRS